jgi:HEAT repeat protein
MALVKKTVKNDLLNESFINVTDAQNSFMDLTLSEEKRVSALEFLMEKISRVEVLNILLELTADENSIEQHIYIELVFSNFKNNQNNEDDFGIMLKMLQSKNVYLRNMVIKYLQENGSDARVFIKKLMQNIDKDLRIFSINILGDVRFEESVEMLRYFIAQEDDINAMMTAVDYLGEIGTLEDIELLEAVKKEHSENPYVVFGVDVAINRIRG